MAKFPVKTEPEPERDEERKMGAGHCNLISESNDISLLMFDNTSEACEIVKTEPAEEEELFENNEILGIKVDPLYITEVCKTESESYSDTRVQFNTCGENDESCSEQKVLTWSSNSDDEPCVTCSDSSMDSSTSWKDKKRKILPAGQIPTDGFYKKCLRSKRLASVSWVHSEFGVEDDSLEEDFDDDVEDSDFSLDISDDDLMPIASDSVTRVSPEAMPDEDSDMDIANEEEDELAPPAEKKKRTKAPVKERKWEKKDIEYAPLPPYTHPVPACIRPPFEYFQDMFTVDLLEDIVYQTNLYARQRNVNTTFNTDKQEMMVFLGIVLYMGVLQLPSIEDYWSTYTKVAQVTDVMSSKRFRLIRSLLHFNNNENLGGSTDKFFKIRPIFASLVKQFLRVKATPTQSVGEVIVAYKGTRSGKLRQCFKTKPDKWGYKLFCRASIDGFIHDILMYQGETTFSNHHQELTQEESELLMSSKTVIMLAKTLQTPSQVSIYAGNYFTSIELVEYLREKLQCRYVGMARGNRAGNAPLMSTNNMDKENVSRGKYDYYSSDGILALRWKYKKIVTILSSDAGIEPVKTIKRYDRNTKKKLDVACPSVVKEYIMKMGGIDKSNILTRLYKTPMRSKRYYLRLFGFALDLCVCNAWILYRRDCNALGEKPMTLKTFRLDISRFARCEKGMVTRVMRTPPERTVVIPSQGQKSQLPPDQRRYDATKLHMPIFVSTRQTCKYCSTRSDVHRSRWMCEVCQVALCLSNTRNCFKSFHTPAAQPSISAISP